MAQSHQWESREQRLDDSLSCLSDKENKAQSGQLSQARTKMIWNWNSDPSFLTFYFSSWEFSSRYASRENGIMNPKQDF